LYLGVIFVIFLLVKALWVQLNIAGEFRHGIVSIFYCGLYTLFFNPNVHMYCVSLCLLEFGCNLQGVVLVAHIKFLYRA
jgi:hypothetical protein